MLLSTAELISLFGNSPFQCLLLFLFVRIPGRGGFSFRRCIYLYFICIDVLPVCVSVHHVHAVPKVARREHMISGTGVTDGAAMLLLGLELRSSVKSTSALTAGLFLQPLVGETVKNLRLVAQGVLLCERRGPMETLKVPHHGSYMQPQP